MREKIVLCRGKKKRNKVSLTLKIMIGNEMIFFVPVEEICKLSHAVAHQCFGNRVILWSVIFTQRKVRYHIKY